MTDISSPAALRIPAILQNPTNRSVRQVAAHNAQQREKADARREARVPVAASYDGRGKRFVRRKDNAAFTANPHIVQPTRADFAPSVPLNYRRIQPTFPPSAVPRSVDAPSVETPKRDPFSHDSHNGVFSTSLKGTRALLRKRGRRAEIFVSNVDRELRDWLGGKGWYANSEADSPCPWRVIDDEMVQIDNSLQAGSSAPSASRRMPEQHQVRDRLPPLPLHDSRVAAILELSRSPAHLTWTVAEGFERLIVHLLARYYELVSWSEDFLSSDNQLVRVTHVTVPSLAQPRLPQSLLTPETTDISDLSAPSDMDVSTDDDTGSEAETEMGDGDVTFTPALIQGIAELHLERVNSNTSSTYASSEGGSEFGMVDSMTLPLPSAGGWRVVSYSDVESDAGDIPPPKVAQNFGRLASRSWEEKPTFFEYLYGV